MAQLDITQIESKLETTKENVSYISEIADKVVGAYTRSLDSLMQEIYKNVVENDNASNNDLEKYFLRLTNTLYFMGEKLERLGLHDDVSKAQFREAYNNAYLDAQTSLSAQGKPTVAMLTISAENGSVNETVVNAIYARSYKTFKFKVDSGFEMVKTLSKIISRRMSEDKLADTPNVFGGLEAATDDEGVFWW